MADFSPYQQKIIRRYYDNFDQVGYQRLSELVTEIYLADGKKRDRLWAQVSDMLAKLKFPQARLDHLLEKKDPAHLALVLKELEPKS